MASFSAPPSSSSELQKLSRFEHRCDACGAKDGISICATCKSGLYCSARCQKEHWKIHKLFCKRLAATVQVDDGWVVRLIQRDLLIWSLHYVNNVLATACVHSLQLYSKPDARKDKIFFVSLKRTSSQDPRHFYTLVDAAMTDVHMAYDSDFARLSKKHRPWTWEEEDAAFRASVGELAIGCVFTLLVEVMPGEEQILLEKLVMDGLENGRAMPTYTLCQRGATPMEREISLMCERTGMGKATWKEQMRLLLTPEGWELANNIADARDAAFGPPR